MTASLRSSLTGPDLELLWHHKRVKEILRTNDTVMLSWAVSVLADAGIEAVVLDTHTSIIEGSISAIPRRLMVADEQHEAATRHLDAARRDLPHG